MIVYAISELYPNITGEDVARYMENNGFDSSKLGTITMESDLSEEETQLFEEIKKRMRDDIMMIKKNAHILYSNMLIINHQSKKIPIFWCFNSWAEPLIFSKKISNDQPLYAMHSFNGYTDNVKLRLRLHDHMVSHYSYLIKELSSNFILIGNCQGAALVESMAIYLQKRFNISPLLITIDYIPEQYYTGAFLMLFGKNSPFNPFKNMNNFLELCNSKLGNFTWGFINATHGGYFFEPAIDEIYKYITNATNIFMTNEKFQCLEMHL